MDGEPDQPKSTEAARKVKKSRTRKCTSDAASDGKPRLGCPFYKRDPEKHAWTISCKAGIGFSQVAKLKDHFKEVHDISIEVCNRDFYFRDPAYMKLPDRASKWKLAFQRLFPEVKEKDIPSPWQNEDLHVAGTPSSRPPEDLSTLLSIIKSRIVDHYRIDILCGPTMPDFEANIDEVLEKAKDEWENGPSVEDVKLAANTLSDDLQTMEQKMDAIFSESDATLITPPPSAPGSPYVETDDTQVFHGLPSTPQFMSTTLDQASNSEAFTPADINNASFAFNNSAFQTPVPGTSSINDFSFNANLLGTWVFVPSASAPQVDMPCMTAPVFEKTQSDTNGWDFGFQTPPAEVVENQLPTGVATIPDLIEPTSPFMGYEASTEYPWSQYLSNDQDNTLYPVYPTVDSDTEFGDVMQWCNLECKMLGNYELEA